jgi:hypothetical protein
MLMSPVGLIPEKDCAENAHQKLKKTDPDLSSERTPHINKLVPLTKQLWVRLTQ